MCQTHARLFAVNKKPLQKTTTLMNSKANNVPRYGIDIDGVLANFIESIIIYATSIGLAEHFPASWQEWFAYDGPSPAHFKAVYEKISEAKQFWLAIQPMPDAVADMGVLPRPTVYITARPIPNEITKQWLAMFGFPQAPLVTVARSAEKVEIAQSYGLTHFIDDLPSTCQQMHRAGITPVLFAQPHNRDAALPVEAIVVKRLSELYNVLWPQPESISDATGYVEPFCCDIPPIGWYCTRRINHDGPCAALPTEHWADYPTTKDWANCPTKTEDFADIAARSNHGADEVKTFANTVLGEPLKETVTATDLVNGYKADAGKPRYDLLPFEALEEIVKVYTFGAHKYNDNNWRLGMRYGRVFAATLRHLAAFIMGQDRDKESGLLHTAHAAFGCLTLCTYLLTGAGTDDRFYTESNHSFNMASTEAPK